MKGTVSFLAAAALVIVAGCASKPQPRTVQKQPWSWSALERARASELIMACGIANAPTIPGAIEKARRRGRVELAHQLETKTIDTMAADFAGETGQEGLRPPEAYIADVKRTVVAWVLENKAVRRGMRYEPKAEGTYTAWAIAVFDPRVLVKAFATHAEKSAGWYDRFRSSATYAELEKHVARYADYIANDP